MTPDYAPLHHALEGEGVLLFTVTELDHAAGVYRRVYSSHPAYPVPGTKPLDHDAYYRDFILPAKTLVANSPEAFRDYFTDHALITALGLGSAVNIPVLDDKGAVRLTLNLLAGPGHFTESRLATCKALVQALIPG